MVTKVVDHIKLHIMIIYINVCHSIRFKSKSTLKYFMCNCTYQVNFWFMKCKSEIFLDMVYYELIQLCNGNNLFHTRYLIGHSLDIEKCL